MATIEAGEMTFLFDNDGNFIREAMLAPGSDKTH